MRNKLEKIIALSITVMLAVSVPLSASASCGGSREVTAAGGEEDDAIGAGIIDTTCPKCGSIGTPLKVWYDYSTNLLWYTFQCTNCNNVWSAATDINNADLTEETPNDMIQ